jgi:hypothetical protein
MQTSLEEPAGTATGTQAPGNEVHECLPGAAP